VTTEFPPLPNGTADHPVDIRLLSVDRRFGIQLPAQCMQTMLEYAVRDYPKETGGVLLGRYTPSLEIAIVTEVSGPPMDSQKARSGFWRGISGLQSLISRLWKEQQYYLGEWHVHPDGPPIPSVTDHDQMRAISESSAYQCPEPLLLILGYSKKSFPPRWSAGAYVFPRQGSHITLSNPEHSGRFGI
jgi:integrative and conjugative element protein (TIGR02256 family)